MAKTNIEQFKSQLNEWLESADAQDLNTINRLQDLKHIADDVEAELNGLSADNKSLVDAYKVAIKHTSFNDQRNAPVDDIGPQAVSFEDALAKFLKNKGE